MTHSEKAQALFREGYNCSQSVLGAFCEEAGMDFATAMCVSAGLGGGVGRLREVCGAVSGMAMVLSLMHGGYEPSDSDSKAELYKKVQQCAEQFRSINGTLICRDLLGTAESGGEPQARTPQFYHERPCERLVGCAAEILEKFLEENK